MNSTRSEAPAAPRRRRRLLWVALGVLALIPLLLFVGALSAPAWYDPPMVPPERQQRTRTELVNAEQAFTQALFDGAQFDYHIYEDMVNRWIAMRRDIFPLADRVVPALVAGPCIRMRDGGITIAGRCEIYGIEAVVSLDLDMTFERNGLVMRATGVRCGHVPIPRTLEALRLNTPLDYKPGKLWPGSPAIHGNLLDGLVVEDRAWWNNGGIAYAVRGLKVRTGQIDLQIEPLGRHASMLESDQ